MERKRDDLIPIGEVISSNLPGPVQAFRDDSPQARHHFTVADQVRPNGANLRFRVPT